MENINIAIHGLLVIYRVVWIEWKDFNKYVVLIYFQISCVEKGLKSNT